MVIPAYNEEHFLPACLKSLQEQIIRPDEVIVVDNNSTDNTAEVARSFGARVISEKKQGIIHARNAGCDAARFEIIARTDADTLLPIDWVKRIKERFETMEIDCLAGTAGLHDMSMGYSTLTHLSVGIFRVLAGGRILPIGPNMAYTRAIWQQIRPHLSLDDKLVHEDFDVGLVIGKMGGKLYYDRDLIVLISARRIKNKPQSFFIEYPTRALKTLWHHKVGAVKLISRSS